MKIFELTTATWVPAAVEHVFDFFSRVENLERLTPAFLNFRILTPTPVIMQRGTVIDYRIGVRGVPLAWRSEITEWDPPHGFVDEQRKGPYRYWKHRHAFEPRDGGTDVIDRVEYATWGGAVINRFVVAPDLRRIFRYRQAALSEYFVAVGPAEAGPHEAR